MDIVVSAANGVLGWAFADTRNTVTTMIVGLALYGAWTARRNKRMVAALAVVTFAALFMWWGRV